MALFETTRPHVDYGVASFASRSAAWVADIAATLVAWNDARVTRKALSALSDRELDDIGLIRGDIDYVASGDLIR